MGIAKDLLEPGGIYEGPHGQRREIVEIIEDTLSVLDSVVYRVSRESISGRAVRLPMGLTRSVKIATFRDWARREIA